jgi:general secretion pathway protein K
MPVDVQVRDLGAKLNVNRMSEVELRTFFQFAIGDYTLADKLAQSIADWSDTDSLPRLRGAERDAYIKAEKLALPTNSAFREVSELLDVMNMTPEIYALVSPYLSTRGSGQVNLNTAPILVLRTLTGMTDAMINNIIQLRSQGRRISNPQQIFGAGVAGGGRGRAGIVQSVQAQQNLLGRVTTETREVELTITAKLNASSRPTRFIADINRGGGNTATIQARLW